VAPFLQGPQIYALISPVVEAARHALLFESYRGATPKQELLPHLKEASTTKFSVKNVKYNRHDRTSCLIIAVSSLLLHRQAYRR
jgi:hypothetical protein